MGEDWNGTVCTGGEIEKGNKREGGVGKKTSIHVGTRGQI